MYNQDNPEFIQRLKKIEGKEYSTIYPYSFPNRTSIQDIISEYSSMVHGSDYGQNFKLKTAGRVIAKRIMGKSTFIDIQEEGKKLQIYASSNTLPQEQYNEFTQIDIGDIYGVEGTPFKTRTDTLTLNVNNIQLLAKSLRSLPEKYHGIQDKEILIRQRYLDLITNPESVELVKTRARIVESLRTELNERGFIEVDTPVLQPIYGGANARPFITHHNSLNQDMYLRISNELYLKRLIIGGLNQVFEFAKDFRNEGIDTTHNPEFTQLEAYQAYSDYNDMMNLVESLVSRAATAVTGSTSVNYQGTQINLEKPWKRISMEDAVKQHSKVDWKNATDNELKNALKNKGIHLKNFTRGHALNSLFEEYVEKKLIQPTIIYDYPIEVSPLAKRHRSRPELVERFEFFIYGREFGNAYSELNDPIDQRERFTQQVRQKESGDDEAHPLDEDFLRAMEYGMPPTGGMGLGLERLVALLTDKKSIKDVILFPAVKQ